MTTWQLLSALVILAAPVLIGGYDVIAYVCGSNAATISRVSLQTAWEYPPYQWAVCFLFGLLCGHLFTHQPTASLPLPRWFVFMAFVLTPFVTVLVTMIAGLRTPDGAVVQATRTYPLLSVLLWLMIGATVGGAFLPQRGE